MQTRPEQRQRPSEAVCSAGSLDAHQTAVFLLPSLQHCSALQVACKPACSVSTLTAQLQVGQLGCAHGPHLIVALIECVDLALLWALDGLIGQDELSHRGVQREAVHAVPKGQHKHGGAAVQAVPSSLQGGACIGSQ